MQVSSGSGGLRAEINVTPLVDVVLVLLIIFMVLSPTTPYHVKNALPAAATDNDESLSSTDQPILHLSADGVIRLNGQIISKDVFKMQFQQLMQQRKSRGLLVKVDDAIDYGKVVEWIGLARNLGATTVAIELSDQTLQRSHT